MRLQLARGGLALLGTIARLLLEPRRLVPELAELIERLGERLGEPLLGRLRALLLLAQRPHLARERLVLLLKLRLLHLEPLLLLCHLVGQLGRVRLVTVKLGAHLAQPALLLRELLERLLVLVLQMLLLLLELRLEPLVHGLLLLGLLELLSALVPPLLGLLVLLLDLEQHGLLAAVGLLGLSELRRLGIELRLACRRVLAQLPQLELVQLALPRLELCLLGHVRLRVGLALLLRAQLLVGGLEMPLFDRLAVLRLLHRRLGCLDRLD